MEIVIILAVIVIAIINVAKKAAAQTKESGSENGSENRSEKTQAQLKEEIWSRISDEAKAQMSSRGYQQKTSAKPSASQTNTHKAEVRTTTILDRAKENNAANEKDVTLDTLEAGHNHSERVAPATHHHEEEDLRESMLGSVEDLMAKGYDGNLCFDRDFLGEAMDMIGRFTAPSEIKELSSKQ